MLNAYTSAAGETTTQRGTPFWIDLLSPTPEEVARVAAESGIRVPTRESLQEIERSSRLRAEGHTLYLSMPLAIQNDASGFVPVPLGFILSPQLLVTVRFAEVHGFAEVLADVKAGRLEGSAAMFATLVDHMVDFSADRLEKLSMD